jgi:apolipoprotein N-acyltransferase
MLRLGVSPRDGLSAFAIGLLNAAAFPPLGLWPLALVAPCLFLLLIRNQPGGGARNLGFCYGLALALGTMYWLFGLFGAVAVALLLVMAGYFWLLGALIGMTQGHRPLIRAILVGLFAVAVEWLRGDAWYLRFPWYTVPHPLAAAPAWIAPARWLGVYGLSFVVWLLAASGAFGPKPVWACFLLLPACSALLPGVGDADRTALLIQVEQPRDPGELFPDILAERVDLAVLPEYAYVISPADVLRLPVGPSALARKVSGPVVFGAVEGVYGTPAFENVVGVIAADGAVLGTFPKQRPVPLFRDGTPGTRRPTFALDEGVLGVAICYDFDAPEVTASLVAGGATVLVAPTFDALSWGRVQHEQHELLLRLRAVESDRWVLRAASSGRSEAVDPHGVPSAVGVPIGETGVVTVGFAHRTGVPLGSRAHLLGPVAAAGTALLLLLAAWRRRSVVRETRQPPSA